jgi:hypothetical protein
MSWTDRIVPSPSALALLPDLLQASRDWLLFIVKIIERQLPCMLLLTSFVESSESLDGALAIGEWRGHLFLITSFYLLLNVLSQSLQGKRFSTSLSILEDVDKECGCCRCS